MIVASFLQQYGIRLRTKEFESVSWDEFKALLAGIGAETPLGRIVSIRAENDSNVLKYFSKEQHRIRNEWKFRGAKNVSQSELDAVLDMFKKVFIKMGEKD